MKVLQGQGVSAGAVLNGKELYGLESNTESELISGKEIGFIGFGDLGKAIYNLIHNSLSKLLYRILQIDEQHSR